MRLPHQPVGARDPPGTTRQLFIVEPSIYLIDVHAARSVREDIYFSCAQSYPHPTLAYDWVHSWPLSSSTMLGLSSRARERARRAAAAVG